MKKTLLITTAIVGAASLGYLVWPDPPSGEVDQPESADLAHGATSQRELDQHEQATSKPMRADDAARTPLKIRKSPETPIDDGIYSIDQCLERLVSPQRRQRLLMQLDPRKKIKSHYFQLQFNPNNYELRPDDLARLIKILDEENRKCIDPYLESMVEQYSDAKVMIAEGRFDLWDRHKTVDLQGYHDKLGKLSRVMIVPGNDDVHNRILVFSRATHPKLYEIEDRHQNARKVRDIAVLSFYKSLTGYVAKPTPNLGMPKGGWRRGR